MARKEKIDMYAKLEADFLGLGKDDVSLGIVINNIMALEVEQRYDFLVLALRRGILALAQDALKAREDINKKPKSSIITPDQALSR